MKIRDFGLLASTLASDFRVVRFNGQEIKSHAGVMELADVTDSKSVGLITRVGSSPTTGTRNPSIYWGFTLFGPRFWGGESVALALVKTAFSAFFASDS